MARIRSIKPEFWQDELIQTLPRDARLLFLGLISHADDEGRFRANPLFVRAQVFPYDPDVDVPAALALLQAKGRIQLYVAEGQNYGWIPKFADHQRIEKPKPSVLPKPPKRSVQDESRTNPGIVQDESRQEGKGEEGSGLEGKGEEGSGLEGKGEEPPPPAVSIEYQEPTADPGTWTGEEFFAWAQWKRQEAGLLGERRRPKGLGSWYSGALMVLNGRADVLQEAFYRFGEDDYWKAKKPPLPFAGFMSQWQSFVPRRAG